MKLYGKSLPSMDVNSGIARAKLRKSLEVFEDTRVCACYSTHNLKWMTVTHILSIHLIYRFV